jgi:hypothetical protein
VTTTGDAELHIDPARVLAALAVLGWADDREASAHVEPDGYEVTPPRHYWEVMEEVIRAADTAADSRHVVEFRAEGWTIMHPLSCRPNLFACRVNRAAEQDLRQPPGVLGLYECDVNDVDLGDRFLILDRVEDPRA